MKLATDVKPNSNGDVIAEFGEKSYVFNKASGMTCDVDDDAHVTHLVNTGNFYPENPEDFVAASTLITSNEDVTDGVDDDEEDEVINGGAPLEALTPVVHTKTPRKAK